MTETMLERAAKAILAKVPFGYMNEAEAVVYARAALEAIREPDEAMIEAGCLAAQDGVGCTPWNNANAWSDGTDGASRQGVRDYVARAQTAMIDAILPQSQEGK